MTKRRFINASCCYYSDDDDDDDDGDDDGDDDDDDDITFIARVPQGCHWLWEQIRMILLGTTKLDSMEKQAGMLERNTVAQLDQLASPRIFNNHLLFHQLPEEARTKRTKLVLIYRNPKAVAVSLYHLHKGAPWWEYNGHFFNWLSLFYDGKGEF